MFTKIRKPLFVLFAILTITTTGPVSANDGKPPQEQFTFTVTDKAPTPPTKVLLVNKTTVIQNSQPGLFGPIPGPGGQQVLLTTSNEAYTDWWPGGLKHDRGGIGLTPTGSPLPSASGWATNLGCGGSVCTSLTTSPTCPISTSPCTKVTPWTNYSKTFVLVWATHSYMTAYWSTGTITSASDVLSSAY